LSLPFSFFSVIVQQSSGSGNFLIAAGKAARPEYGRSAHEIRKPMDYTINMHAADMK